MIAMGKAFLPSNIKYLNYNKKKILKKNLKYPFRKQEGKYLPTLYWSTFESY
jgi:hypothetical protein